MRLGLKLELAVDEYRVVVTNDEDVAFTSNHEYVCKILKEKGVFQNLELD